jgi:hypothetical protein
MIEESGCRELKVQETSQKMKFLIFILVAVSFSGSFVESKRSVGAPSKANIDDIERIRGLLNDHIQKLNLT